MRCKLILGVSGLCICLSGCRLASDITQNMVFETRLFADDVKAKVYYPCLASSAWNSYRAGHIEQSQSSDFGCGFKLGYADYLENGGEALAHPLPPMRYWKIRNETPAGRAATELWLAGFRKGAVVARASGYRELIVVPVGGRGLTPPPDDAPLVVRPAVPQGPPAPQEPSMPLPDELPNPRSLPYSPMNWREWTKPTEPVPAVPTPSTKMPDKPLPSQERGAPTPKGAGANPGVPRQGQSRKSPEEAVQPDIFSEDPNLLSASAAAETDGRQGAVVENARYQPSQTLGQQGKGETPSTVPASVPQIVSSNKPMPQVCLPARDKTPRNADMHYRVGMVAMRAGSVQLGLSWLYSALNEDPNHAPSHRALMEYYQKVGDFYRAAEHRVKAGSPPGDDPEEQESSGIALPHLEDSAVAKQGCGK